LPSAVFGLLGILFVYLIATRLTSPSTALLAAFLLAVNPLDVWYGQEARWYAQWTAMSTLSWILLLRVMDQPTFRRWGAYATAVVLNCYTFVLTPLVVIVQALAILVYARTHARQQLLRQFATTAIVAVLACLPVLFVVAQELGTRTGTPRPFTLSALPYTFYAYSVGLTYGPSVFELHSVDGLIDVLRRHLEILPAFLLFSLLTLKGVVALWREGNRGRLVVCWFLGTPVLLFALNGVSGVAYNVRYTLASLPAYIIVLASALISIKSIRWRLGASIALLIFVGISLVNNYGDWRYDRPHVRNAIIQALEHETTLPAFATCGQVSLAVNHYARRAGLDVAEVCHGSHGVQLPSDTTAPLWLLVGRDYNNAASECLDSLSDRYRVAARSSVPGVELWRLIPQEITRQKAEES